MDIMVSFRLLSKGLLLKSTTRIKIIKVEVVHIYWNFLIIWLPTVIILGRYSCRITAVM
jgi:hypothetical protein